MKNKILYILSFCIFISVTLKGSDFILTDTVHIEELKVFSETDRSSPGFNSIKLDTNILENYKFSGINDIISKNSSIHIRTYGNGGIASSSFRGTGASHTQVNWNGMKLNNPMLGQFDFSLLPVFFVDDIELIHGSGDLTQHSGALGGTVFFTNIPDWNRNLDLTYSSKFASYLTFAEYLELLVGNKKQQFKTKLHYESSKNDYKYYDKGFTSDRSEINRRINAEYKKAGIINEYYLKLNKNTILSYQNWFNSNNRNIPFLINTSSVNKKAANQIDNNFKSVIQVNNYSDERTLSFFSGLSYDYLGYTSETENSRNSVFMLINRLNYSNNFSGNQVKGGICHEYDGVNTNNYRTYRNRSILSSFISFQKKFEHNYSGTVSLRQEIVNSNFSPLLPAVGLQKKINKFITIKINASRNYKLPDLNDLYWDAILKGNPDLKHEDGFTLEYCAQLHELRILDRIRFFSGITLYNSTIKNRIIWLPPDSVHVISTDFRDWSPVNLQYTLSKGLEWNSKIVFQGINQFKSILSIHYAYTSIHEKQNNKQLIYVPFHKWNASFSNYLADYYISLNSSYTGKIYFTSNHDAYLPPFLITDLIAGRDLNFPNLNLDIQLRIDNVFNENYMIMNMHPMPRRIWNLVLSANFFK
ncbi:TonB-dependent receptor plug domain-containing protein [Bacteroidota bacterium]